MNAYILDTNVFNWILGGEIHIPLLNPGVSYYATHVQRDELSATPDPSRRKRLLPQFSYVDPEALPTESRVVGVSRIGLAELSDGALFSRIRDELDARNGGKPNDTRDALIAETAINTGLVLVTEDTDLLTVVAGLGGPAIRIRDIDPSGPPSKTDDGGSG